MTGPGFKIGDAYRFAAAHGLEAKSREIRSMRVHPGIKKRHVPRKGAFVELFENLGLMDQFSSEHWPARLTDQGKSRRQQYLDLKNQNEALLRGEGGDEDILDEAPGVEDDAAPSEADLAAFAMEAQLRDFIVENISRIPVGGARVQLFRDAEGRDGREYPTDVGPIDILAVNDTGDFFVFELKLDRGPDRALGQLARYMGWVKIHLAKNRDVRGVVVARSIDEKLKYAACVMPNVVLLEYEVEFRLHDAGAISAQPNNALQPAAGEALAPSKPSEPGRG